MVNKLIRSERNAKLCYKGCATLAFVFLVGTLYLSHLLYQVCVDVSGNGSPSNLLRTKRDTKDCTFNFNVSGSGGTLTSPDFPDKYPSNADCRWLLETTEPNSTLLLRIDTLQIEPDTNCKLDYLQVYLGSSTLAPSLGPFCGNIKDRVLKTNSSLLLLVFHSDPIYEDKGFSIDYFTQSAGDCKSSLTEPSGVIRSPGFPNNYPDSNDCWTLIEVSPNKKIALHFESLDLEYGDNCTYDYIQIYNGATRHSGLLGQVCRLQKETNFESSGNQLLLHFHSDESVNRKGYKAVYSAIDKRSIKIGDCLWEKDDFNGTIASPNYPANYPSNSNCSLWLQAPENHQIMIVFDALQLEIDSNCSYDYLQMKDGPPPDSKSIGSFCGKITEPKQFTSTTNEVNIVFHSDDFAEFSGFKLRYWFLNNETEESETESIKTGEVGKASFEMRPENATLPIGSSYMLRCSTRHPLAKIRWLKDDRFLSGGTPLPGLKALNNNTLWIKSMDHHLSGQYTCVIVTAEETISSNAYILTESGSRNNESTCGIVFRKVPRDASFAEGEFAYLECLAAGTNVQFSWEKDGIPLQRSKRITILQNGLLYVDRVTLEDAGVYSCLAYDDIGKCQKKASAFLQVSERAKIEEICGIPKAGKPSSDIPLMEHGKIVGGHNTKKGAYPWQVMLWEPTLKSFCGGSLLNERWIATAAHCFVHYKDLRWDRIIIKLGKYDREREEVEEFRTGIADLSSIVVHPAYNKLTFDNDLALVRLRDHVRFFDYILPICLGDREMGETFLNLEGQTPRRIYMGTVTGWGKLKESGPSPRYLQEIKLPIVDQKTCTESTNYTVSRNMFCAGYAQEILGDACHGDSGGPFLMPHENRWYLLGIVSWGEGCGKANKYGFYTRIPNYLPWIKGIMKS